MDYLLQTILTGEVRPVRNDTDRELIIVQFPSRRLNDTYSSVKTLLVNVPDEDFDPNAKGRDERGRPLGKVAGYLKYGLRYNANLEISAKCSTIAVDGFCPARDAHGSSFVHHPEDSIDERGHTINGNFRFHHDEQDTIYGVLKRSRNVDDHEIISFNLPARRLQDGWIEDDLLIINMPEYDENEVARGDSSAHMVDAQASSVKSVRCYLKHQITHEKSERGRFLTEMLKRREEWI